MTSEVDYLLRMLVPDLATYDQFYKELISGEKLSYVSFYFAVEEKKFATALPLGEETQP